MSHDASDSHTRRNHAGTAECARSLVVGWTGHRQLDDETAVAAAVEQVIATLVERAGVERLVGVGSVAKGADLIVAEALAERGVPLIILLPFARERFEKDAPEPVARRIDALVRTARCVGVADAQESDDLAYLETGTWMVDHADVVIAVWNGQERAGVGGTKDVIDHARELDRPVIVVDSKSAAVAWPTEEEMDRISKRSDGERLLRGRADVERAFHEQDRLAEGRGRQSRFVLLRVILLHLLASSIAISAAVIFSAPSPSPWLIVPGVLKVGMLVWAFVLATSSRAAHHGWIEARARAELCRAYLAVWTMRRDVIRMPPAPTSSTNALRRELEIAWRLDQSAAQPLETARKAYLEGTTEAPDDANRNGRIGGQQHYFGRTHVRAHRKGHGIELAARCLTGLAIALGLGGIAATLGAAREDSFEHEHALLAHVVKASAIVLPLVVAALLSIATALDFTRRAARYREMNARLGEFRKRVAAARTWTSLGRAVTDTEWLLQAEVSEWHAFRRYAAQAH